MNAVENVDMPVEENKPVFFTGLSENRSTATRKSLLCLICGSSLAKNSKNNDALNNGSSSGGECEKCDKTFENIKKAMLFLSNSPLLKSSSSSLLSAQIQDPGYSGQKRKSLLPTPKPDLTDDSPYSQTYTPVTNKEQSNLTNAGEKVAPESKRKNEFDGHSSKKPKYEHKFNVNCDSFVPDNHSEKLSKTIWKLFQENKQTQEVYAKKMTLRDKLHEILHIRFPNSGLYVVGSSMTGLGAASSDMDMCFMLTDSEIDQENEAKNILHDIQNLFLNYSFISDVEVIYARVPILRFIDRVNNIEVDLNINNSVGIRNTQLLSSYARIDKRLPPLILLVKMWARHNGINDAKNNTLSSYSLVLMVIHFLQHGCNPPVLPCLQKMQPDKYLPRSNVRKLKLVEDLPDFCSSNHQNLGELFSGFLKYFSYDFDYFRNVMSVRLGTVLPKETAMKTTFSPKNKRGHWKWVCIEEPFELTNTACAVFKPGVFRYIKQVFENSCVRLRRTRDLNGIIR